ncbi:hypothetical protein [Kribbella sp. NPDC051770]|uniref:hypothetical protein n=1 Tax=Kribbella sp. NPDC051770 TaxID=3155413 RepID=UPI003445FB5D
METLTAHHHATLAPPQEGDELVDVSIGPYGELIAIWAAAGDLPALRAEGRTPDGEYVPDDLLLQPVGLRVVAYNPEPTLLVSIPDYRRAWPTAQPMPGGNVLVVGSRSEWHEGVVAPNAILYDASGAVVGEQLFGDGIQHVRATPSGQVWVGYADEGVYGNLGWGFPGPPPIGAAGLLRFGPELDLAWELPGAAAVMDDLEAINVAGEVVWASYYLDYPIVEIVDGRVRSWSTSAGEVRALAVSGDQVALVIQGLKRLVVGRLEAGRHVVEREYALDLPNGAQVFGWGPELHVVAGREWFQLELPWDDSTRVPASLSAYVRRLRRMAAAWRPRAT